MARLIVLSGDEIGREFPLQGEVVIGRQAGCSVVLADASVSREHARLRIEGGRAVVTDLKSSNGTFINGARLETAELRPGDELRLGKFTLRFAADIEVEEIQLGDEKFPAAPEPVAVPSSVATPSPAKAAGAPSRKISNTPVRAIPKPDARGKALMGQDVLQYGGYYRFAIVLAGLAIAGGVFLGVRWISAKVAEKSQHEEPAEEER